MSDAPRAARAVGPDQGPTIRSVASEILDVPTIREHKLSALAVTRQSVVLARVLTSDGVEGVGEASTLGGPLWAEESVETIKAVIDRYLTPALIGRPLGAVRAARAAMDAAARRNAAAKGAIETALWDALGKTLDAPVHAFLGGAVRQEAPALWALASGDPAQEVEEALGMIERGRHTDFKIKIGAQAPEADLARLRAVARGIEGRGRLAVVDANQAWDEPTADRCIPALDEIGVRLLEQPLPAANLAGAARLAARHALPLLADESVFTPEDAVAVGVARAADAVSLKIVKHGGLLGVMDVAAAARA
ncbi:MAG: enolase C-terminal domain-like protein, partial [Pseudomonadota bacterium]